MKIKDIMSYEVDCIKPSATLQEAAEQMKICNYGFIPICEDGYLLGAITDRDIVIRGVAKGLDVNSCTVNKIISDEIRYCFENDDVEEAAQLMEELQIRRLAVLNENKELAGIITLGDIATKTNDLVLAGEIIESVSE